MLSEQDYSRHESDLQSEIDHRLRRYLASAPVDQQLKEVVEYALFPGGKRVRPFFSLCLCQDLGGDISQLITAVPALEMVHCASLVHDDLPALDNDEMRRGKKTSHRKFGEAAAVLAGDAMAVMAMDMLAKSTFGPEHKIRLIECLAGAFCDLCAGQQRDLADGREDQLLLIHRLKTGALFGAAAFFAGIGAKAETAVQRRLRDVGVEIGVFFQVIDDYLDVFGTDDARGRSGSSDTRNNRRGLFSAGNADEGRAVIEALERDCLTALDSLKNSQNIDGRAFWRTRQVLAKIAARVG